MICPMEDLRTVVTAIQTLHGSDVAAQGKASVWLTEFQKTPGAWKICDEILRARNCFLSMHFAAQTMRQKILTDFKQLSPEVYESLSHSLVEHLLQVNCADKNDLVVMTQLSLALIDFYLQVPNAKNFIIRLLEIFSNHHNDRTLVILSLLKVCPEEARNPKVRVGQNRRDELEVELAAVTDQVLAFLTHVCHTYPNNTHMIGRAILSLSTWLQNPKVQTNKLVGNPILMSTIEALQLPVGRDPEVLDAATECLAAALYRVEDVDKHQDMARVLQAGVLGMIEAFDQFSRDDDFGKMQLYGKVFSEAGETFLESIVRCPGDYGFGNLAIVELMVLMAECNDYALLDLGFNFWYRMSEYLFQDVDEELLAIFKPFVLRYMKSLLKHCRYDADLTELPDPSDDFAEFRMRISDSIKDVLFIVGCEECMKLVHEYYQEVDKSWFETEAVMFFFSSIVQNILPTENHFVPSVLDLVVNTPETAHPALNQTMIHLIRNADEWIQAHPDCLDSIMSWVIRRLPDLRLAVNAAKAIACICDRNGKKVANNFTPLYHMIHEHYERSNGKGATIEAVIQALYHACTCLMNDEKMEVLAHRLETLACRPNHVLMKLTSDAVPINLEQSRTTWAELSAGPTIWLDRLAVIYRYLKPLEDQRGVIAANGIHDGVWTTITGSLTALLRTMRFFAGNTKVVEHACRAIRFVIRSVGYHPKFSLEAVGNLAGVMVELYPSHQHSCFLYLGSILVDEYGSKEDFQHTLFMMMESLANCSFELLKSPESIRNHPDTIDDLYRMAYRFLQRAPACFLPHALCETMFLHGMKAIHIDHQDAQRSLTMFFGEIESLANVKNKKTSGAIVYNAANALFEKHGNEMTCSLLSAAIFDVSANLKRNCSDMMHYICVAQEAMFPGYLRHAMELLPHDTTCSATQAQLRDFHAKMIRAQDSRVMLTLVRELCTYYY
ncbi:hypothetical protein L596_002246 [Steinernema carpocapsae]|uniref:Importin N-terminal domain-containing protein n=1 Tax=Steinernema carpocapsae TaxID=34508 RepID=A0A4U8UNK6_STECR|nr:hypothetical protein L596_002246 [Steinernema carpocapsae]